MEEEKKKIIINRLFPYGTYQRAANPPEMYPQLLKLPKVQKLTLKPLGDDLIRQLIINGARNNFLLNYE